MLSKTIDVDAVAKRVAYQGFTYWGCRDRPISFGWLQKLESHLLDVADAPAQHSLMLEETMNLSSEPDERAAVNRLVFELARIPVECRVFSKDERSVMIEIRGETTSSQFAVGSRHVPQTTFPAGYDMETLHENAVCWFFFTRDELKFAGLLGVCDIDNNYQDRLSVPTWDEQDSIVHWVLGKTGSEFGIIVSDELYPETDRLVSETEDGDPKYIKGWRFYSKTIRTRVRCDRCPENG